MQLVKIKNALDEEEKEGKFIEDREMNTNRALLDKINEPVDIRDEFDQESQLLQPSHINPSQDENIYFDEESNQNGSFSDIKLATSF